MFANRDGPTDRPTVPGVDLHEGTASPAADGVSLTVGTSVFSPSRSCRSDSPGAHHFPDQEARRLLRRLLDAGVIPAEDFDALERQPDGKRSIANRLMTGCSMHSSPRNC